MIYHGLVSSHLRYGILSWGPAKSTALEKLNKLHDRVIKHLSPRNMELGEAYSYLGIFNINSLYKFELAKFIFLFKMKKTPKAFDGYIVTVSHSYATRSHVNELYQLYKPRTEKGKTLIKLVGVNFWNSLPLSLTKFSETLSHFKSKLREYLLSCQSA